MGENGAQVLAALKDAPSLHTLYVDLGQNSVGESGAQALAALKDAASLHTLSLRLGQNSMGDRAAQALAALKDAASLHTVRSQEKMDRMCAHQRNGPQKLKSRRFSAVVRWADTKEWKSRKEERAEAEAAAKPLKYDYVKTHPVWVARMEQRWRQADVFGSFRGTHTLLEPAQCGAAGAAGSRSGSSTSAASGEPDGTHQVPVGKGWQEKGGRGKGALRKDDQAPLQTPACKGPA